MTLSISEAQPTAMTDPTLSSPPPALDLALIHEVFADDESSDEDRLGRHLARARELGAELAVLPELPLDPWFPVHPESRLEDAEPPAGRRHQRLARAAREAGIGVLGGAVVVEDHRRTNRALLFDARGELVAAYDKLHLPSEAGFWENRHYEPGADPPTRVDAFGVPLGLQICSDINRPVGCHLLAAQGAAMVLAPRATERATYARWRLVLRANALTSCVWMVSVTRPRPEAGVELGGPSVVIAPDGEVVLETEEPVSVVRIDLAAVIREQGRYPGYMPHHAGIYASAWSQVAS